MLVSRLVEAVTAAVVPTTQLTEIVPRFQARGCTLLKPGRTTAIRREAIRDTASLGIIEAQLMAPMKLPLHQSTIVLVGLRGGTLISPPLCRETIVSRVAVSLIAAVFCSADASVVRRDLPQPEMPSWPPANPCLHSPSQNSLWSLYICNSETNLVCPKPIEIIRLKPAWNTHKLVHVCSERFIFLTSQLVVPNICKISHQVSQQSLPSGFSG